MLWNCKNMNAINFVVTFWLVFLIVWGISSINAKRDIRSKTLPRGAMVRILFGLIIVVLVQIPDIRDFIEFHPLVSANPVVEITGVILCGLGIAFAIWARINLGKNWGMPMSLKEKPELVTAGPYKFVRHPIYTGVILAMIGSALVGGIIWIVVCLFFCVYFVSSAFVEEKIMEGEFKDEYLQYKKKTKMLIPFIF